MQTAAPFDSCGDVRSVGPTSGTQRQTEPSGTQRRKEANRQEAGKTLLSTSTYILLIYSMLAPPSVRVIRMENLRH